MAPRRKQKAAEPREQGREVKLRVPENIMKMVEQRAAGDRRPINATIVSMLALLPHLELIDDMDDLRKRYETMLSTAEVSFARYSSEITRQVLSRELLETVDKLLEMETDHAIRHILARLRAVRAEMRNLATQERTGSLDRSPKG
jgi:hypothetical protein